MLKCEICGSSDFYRESGYLFCTTCQTQSQDVGEELEFEFPTGSNVRLKKTRIRSVRSGKTEETVGWTSWELYNFALIGLTNELIELGAPANIKITVLQLWARYLGKLEVAFMSTKKKLIPKLSRRYKKRDAEIIYGKISKDNNRKRKTTGSTVTESGASTCPSDRTTIREINRNKKLLFTADYDRYMQSQASSEGDALSTLSQSAQSSVEQESKSKSFRIRFNSSAKEETRKIKRLAKRIPRHKRGSYKKSHVTTEYKSGPEMITTSKLLAILYLSLRIHNQDIHLGDMLRYGREGHLSYYRLDCLIPPEVALTRQGTNFLSRVTDVTHKGMRRIIGRMAKFLGVREIICPNFSPLVNRYCSELALPNGVSLYAERLIALSPPKLFGMIFDKKSCIPNYEGRAMAFVIVVMKVLLGLDGVTEHEISNVADRINRMQCRCDAPCVLVHGGTGSFDDALIVEKLTSCKTAASVAYQSLLGGATSVEAVEAALRWLERDEFFNCGYGTLLNETGEVQMDATIADGLRSECGSVAAVSDIEHPISLARYVLETLPDSIAVGEGARELAEHANLNRLSPGSMIAPAAYLAYKLTETDGSCYCTDTCSNTLGIEKQRCSDLTENSGSSVGCVAYDGRAIAAGVTGGGPNRKLAGTAGNCSLLGCNVYADRDVGCSLTGDGESVMKLGLSRVIADDIRDGCSPWRALKRALDRARAEHSHTVGGVALRRTGDWGVYFTSSKMPHAVIANDRVTFGTALDDRSAERYEEYRQRFPCSCNFPTVINSKSKVVHGAKSTTGAISVEGICDVKLFSFREWQRYIECRRAVLVNAHCPTKLKHSPNTPDLNSLYVKFLESVDSKADRESPEVVARKHLVPCELVQAMKQCVSTVSHIDVPLNEVTEFFPSLTPHRSYLQQLLEHPLRDLPRMLRNDFASTKIGYTTKPEYVRRLAAQHDMRVNLIDSNLHFVEKRVPLFEQRKMPAVRDLKEKVVVRDLLEDATCAEGKEDFTDYLHRGVPCELKIDATKSRRYRERWRATADTIADVAFAFTETLPDGKLSIPDRSDDKSDQDDALEDDVSRDTRLLSKFCETHNLNLSRAEARALLTGSSLREKPKCKPARNARGKFVRRSDIPNDDDDDDDDDRTDSVKEAETASPEKPNVTDPPKGVSGLPDISYILNTNASLFDELTDDRSRRESNELVFGDLANARSDRSRDSTLRLFRPFGDYWMYHCVFSRVKPKNFELLEKMLPRSFRWLLNECANVVEMPAEDLYEEVCVVEELLEKFIRCLH